MTLPVLDLAEENLMELPTTRGATDCQYFRHKSFNSVDLFIKRGEKVSEEIGNYETLHEVLHTSYFLKPVGIIDQSTIALPFAQDPKFGFDMVEALWQYSESIDQFVEFQRQAFVGLGSLYEFDQSLSDIAAPSNLFAPRVQERIKRLDEISELTFREGYLEGVSIGDLLYSSVPVVTEGKMVHWPSLTEMVGELWGALSEPHPYKSCLIHADPQVSNVVMHGNSIKIIDLSDLKWREDPAWDIAKWMNYVCRFHEIVKRRVAPSQIPFGSSPITCEIAEYLRNDVVNQVGKQIDADPEELSRRSILCEFIVNVNTLRRHSVKFPEVVTGVTEALVETYLNAKSLIEN